MIFNKRNVKLIGKWEMKLMGETQNEKTKNTASEFFFNFQVNILIDVVLQRHEQSRLEFYKSIVRAYNKITLHT